MNINDCYPSKYLSASDLDGRERSLTIREVLIENLAGPGQPADEKPVVYFENEPKGMGLNKTNAASISERFGPETNGWIGKTIVLFPTQTDFKGQSVACIRIKLSSTATPPTAAASSPPLAPPPPAVTPPTNATTKGEAWAAFTAWHGRQNATKPGSFTNDQLVAGWNAAIADVGKPESEFVATDWAWMATSGVGTLEIPF